jgi:uncharacterized BrkB/YihY/UPF0761 family membrane protein
MAKTEKELLENILKETQYQRRLTSFISIVTVILTLYLISYSITSILIQCKSIGNPSCYSPYLGAHSIGFGTADFILIGLLVIGFIVLRKDLSQTHKYVWIGITVLAIIILAGALI